MTGLSKKVLASFTAIILVFTLIIPFTASAATTTTFNNTYDYFTDKYSKLTDKDHVFKTAEYYQFYNYFLGGTDLGAIYGATANATVQPASGKYVFLLGGVWSNATQAGIGYVNDVAKEFGVTAIYNFDPKLDGEGLDISTDAVYATKYNAILTKLGVSSLTYPSVIVYQKDSVTTGHVVSSYSWSNTSFANQTAIDNFKTALRTNAFTPAATSGKITNIKVSDSDYIRSVLNARYYSNYNGTAYRAPLKPLPENKSNVYEVVTLNELRGLLSSQGNYAVLFGGLWCHNTWAVVNLIEQYAEQYGITKIYFYDTVLDSGSSSTSVADQLQTRSTTYKLNSSSPSIASPIAHLYVDLINDFVPNIYTLNQGGADGDTALNPTAPVSASNIISYTSGTNTVTARRVQLPNFFVYNKDHKDANGKSAPVINQVEIMTELWRLDPTATGTGSDAYNAGGVFDQYTVGYNRTVNASYTYWAPGLNQVLGEFTGIQLSSLITKAEALKSAAYSKDSFAKVSSALAAAKTVKSSIDTAVTAKAATATAPKGSDISSAYAALDSAITGLVAATATTSSTSSNTSSNTNSGSDNPATGDTGSGAAIVVLLLAASSAVAFGALKRKEV